MRPLRVLMAEDSSDDEELILRELRRGGFDVSHERVQTAEAMRKALAERAWDIILSDFSMPEFSAPGALAVRRASGLDIPLIIVSGTTGEDIAVRSLHAGAQDFILKGKLERLLPAIERELREPELRQAHRAAEEALRASEARLKIRDRQLAQHAEMFRELFEAAPDGILLVEESGVIALANARAERMFGYEPGALPGAHVDVLFPTTGLPKGAVTPQACFATPDVSPTVDGSGFRARRRTGHEFPVDMSFAPFSLDGRPIALGTVRDITAQRAIEAQLRQAQKMEAVGRLAAGVAHDFNNILSVILSYAQMQEEDLATGESLRDSASEIRAAAMRAVDLTRQLLTFSRQQMRASSPVDLDLCVASMESMLRRLLGAHIKLTVLAGSSPWKLFGNTGEVEQVLMNLAVNARDAMPDGGSLTVETKRVVLDEEYTETHPDVVAGPHLMLSVTDTGVGIDKETQGRIFEPFFTTKDAKGTGLGLATVFGLVKQSRGHIWVYSEVGIGTTFRIYFPRTDDNASPRPSLRPEPEVLTGTETILLVEDDDHVRAVAAAILRRNGYTVLEASNGGEALLICEQHLATIHLLLTDVVLPRMSGRQLAERLGPARPEMRVLFMSGYTDDAIMQHGILNSDVEYLQKPITPAALSRRVRGIFTAPANEKER